QQYAQRERNDDTRVADDYCVVRFVFQNAKVEFHPDDEPEQDESNLTQELQISYRFQRKQRILESGEVHSQQRRSEYNPRDDFTDNRGLPDFPEKPPEEPCYENYRDNLR